MRETGLDSLWKTTESLVNLLSAPKPASRPWRNWLSIERDHWAKKQSIYMDRDDFLIDLQTLLETLGEDSRMRGRVIMAAANATSLLNEFFKVSENKRDPLSLLERLDQDFPLPFFTYAADDPSEVITEDVVKLGLDICTQLLIAQLEGVSRRDSHRTPTSFAVPLFCRLEDDSINPDEALRHGPHTDICGLAEEYFRDRAHDILALIEDKPVDEALSALHEAYPFYAGNQGGFFGTIFQWASGIIEETKDFMRGPSSSMRGSSPTDSLASSIPRQTVRHENTLTRTQGTRSPSATPVPRRGTTAESSTGPNYDPDDLRQRSPSLDDEFDAGAIAFARRTQPPRPQSTAGPSSSAPEPPARQVSGFTADDEDDDDEDDPFEQDDREPDPQRREQLDRDRRNMPPPPPRPAKRQRLPSHPRPTQPSSSLPPSSANSVPPSRNPSRAAPISSNPSSSASAPAPTPTPSSADGVSFTQIREMNRKVPARGAGMQQRVPWSDADVRRLIRLIEYHSCVWAKIAKRQDARQRIGDPGPEDTEGCIFDHPRDQQAIRDKARNLKVDLLKGDHPLYPGFDNIALGKKERNSLIERMKNPDRRESDIDENGDPTNTVYVPDAPEDEVQE
ncbi:Myb DNA-binding domain protein [Colletotrichum plurivorum]|uniref:Myb DNA-binding domain protein n=1 Tax=Colletotrichum plurivorum TaxID=2175906 RepID=A0A8H6KSR7_9PEZI|nr:Myb DNA-binding domain protein [Colletotrichum plurivorum]